MADLCVSKCGFTVKYLHLHLSVRLVADLFLLIPLLALPLQVAALHMGLIVPVGQDLDITDRTPLSLGIAIEGDTMTPVLEIDAKT